MCARRSLGRLLINVMSMGRIGNRGVCSRETARIGGWIRIGINCDCVAEEKRAFFLCITSGGRLKYRERVMLVTRFSKPGKRRYHKGCGSGSGNKEAEKTRKTSGSKYESISSVFLAVAITDHV